jgi:hypothetical protein
MSSSGSESESGLDGGQTQAESPEDCTTPEQRESSYMQPTSAQPAGPGMHPEATVLVQQVFEFDFDFDNDVWVSSDPYAQLATDYLKDQPDWLIQGPSFTEQFV